MIIHKKKHLGLGSESPRTHLSPCVLFRYNTKLYIVVRGDSEPIPTLVYPPQPQIGYITDWLTNSSP